MYLCHDMKGGYAEDTHFLNNTPPASTYAHPNAYRALHLEQAEVFNYFSHHSITIPPTHWRLACQRHRAKCLGTFIVEGAGYP